MSALRMIISGILMLAVAIPTFAEKPAPLALTVQEAIMMGLDRNQALIVERLNPQISRTFEQQERAVFDPTLAGQLSREESKAERFTTTGANIQTADIQTFNGGLALSDYLPTGTRLALSGDVTGETSSLASNELYSTRAGISVTQSLLQGGRISANLASLHQARLDVLSSQYELRGFAEALVANVEGSYWDYLLAQRQIEIVSNSLNLAQQQLDETKERIHVGALASVEVSAAQAEVALRYEALINAHSALETAQLQLLHLLNPPGSNRLDRMLIIRSSPSVSEVKLDTVNAHVQLAWQKRPELNQARLNLQRGELEVVKTRNGLLPKLDLFINLGKTGYANSFGDTTRHMNDGMYDATVGVQLAYPLGDRDAKAQHRRALLSRIQAGEALTNLEQLVESDVRSAYIEVNRVREQISATAATRRLQEETARAETEKFRVGKSTAILVAAAERDLLQSRISEVQAVIDYRKALADLFRLDGSLLDRYGIEISE